MYSPFWQFSWVKEDLKNKQTHKPNFKNRGSMSRSQMQLTCRMIWLRWCGLGSSVWHLLRPRYRTQMTSFHLCDNPEA